MQRVLSGERARCVESSEEFVTKKLCVSFIIVCAFFSVLGGFFLGRYASEQATASRKTFVPFVEQKLHSEILTQLSNSLNKIENLTTELSFRPPATFTYFNYSQLYTKLQCSSSDHNLTIIPDIDYFIHNVNVGANEIIMTDLNFLQQCYSDVSTFLESVLVPD